MTPPQLDFATCRTRQQRLIPFMENHDLDWVVVSTIEDVQWLSGIRFPWMFSTVAAMNRAGQLTLVAPHRAPAEAAADTIERYDAKWHSTLRNDQRAASTQKLLELVGDALRTSRVGIQFSAAGVHLIEALESKPVDLDAEIYRLRRRKDEDELAMLRQAIAGTEKMYQVAREMIRPGVTELDVFNTLQSAAVDTFGEMLTGTGNDYQCNSRGGPPRNQHAARAGELYILDLGPAYQGYFADNARTIAVDGVSAEQATAWEFIQRAFQHVESTVKPGKSCQELFEEVQAILDECPVGVFNHHLGHGIGLYPHEAPHLNPHWDDVFQEGEVFTAEPGLYAPELSSGMRIENDYLVTSTGVENLSPFPMELA